MSRRLKHLFFIVLWVTALPANVAASDSTSTAPANRGKLLLRWVDAQGKSRPAGHVETMRWVWSKISPQDALESPALRIWLEPGLPDDWTATHVTGDSATLSEPYAGGKKQKLVLDLRATRASLRFEFSNHLGKRIELTLSIQMAVQRPYFHLHPSCESQHINATLDKNDAQHLHVGMYCKDLGDSVDIYFYRSNDSSWNSNAGLVQFDPNNKYIAFRHHMAKPAGEVFEPQSLFRVGTLDENRRESEYTVFFQTPKRSPRFFAQAAAVTSYYNYTDQKSALRVSQYSVGAEGTGGAYLWQDRLAMQATGRCDAFALTHTPKREPEARFYAGSLGLEYRFGLTASGLRLALQADWQVWGMAVSDQKYGLTTLNGPMALLRVEQTAENRAPWSTWLSYSGIGEWRAGLAHALKSQPKAFALRFEVARTDANDGRNAARIWSASLGVQKPF